MNLPALCCFNGISFVLLGCKIRFQKPEDFNRHNLTQIIILLLNLMQFQHLSMLVHVQHWFCSLSYFTKRKIQDVNFNIIMILFLNLRKNTLKHSYSEAPRAYLDSLLLYLFISDKLL